MAVSMSRRGDAYISALQCHRDNRAGLHVDGMFGFVRQMRAAIFQGLVIPLRATKSLGMRD